MMSEKPVDPAYTAALSYEEYLVPSIFRYWTPFLIERAAPKTGEKVLDVACGTGAAARAMVPLVGETGKVTGLDKNSAMLSVACRKFSEYCDEIDWWEGVAENLPFPWQSFDLVVCQQGLQFFTDRSAAAHEMQRVLRPGGRAVIAVWQSVEHHPFYHQVYSTIAARMGLTIASLAEPHAFGDPHELSSLLHTAGFTHVHVDSVTQDVFFPHPERFLELTFRATSAVLPIYTMLDAQHQSSTLTAVKHELSSLIYAHTHNGVLTFPMKANIALAVT
jgi:ubiquinone/menaquinone biosynthesis C-methylase UbiE